MKFFRSLSIAAGCFAASLTAQASDTAPPVYSADAPVVHVPFAEKVNFDKLGFMGIRVSINGGPPMVLQVDTGSVGVIVGVDQVPNVDLHGPAGSIVYVSSGNELDGVWTPTTITFLDAVSPDGKPVTAELPVLAAQKYQHHAGAVNGGKATTTSQPAKPPTHPPHPAMFGVGFGRGGGDGHPERNPFVTLTAMQDGTMRRGYTITRDGYDLGLSSQNTSPGYLFEKLDERPVSADTKKLRPGLRDWLASRGSVAVGNDAPIPVGILMDTGLTNFMIELPTVTENKDIAPGTKVTVGLLNDRLHYSFTTGDKTDPMAPRRVTWTKRPENALLNTGLKSLAGYDYLFDCDGGFFALRPTRERQ